MIMIHNMIIYKYKNKIKYKLYQRLNYNKKYKNWIKLKNIKFDNKILNYNKKNYKVWIILYYIMIKYQIYKI